MTTKLARRNPAAAAAKSTQTSKAKATKLRPTKQVDNSKAAKAPRPDGFNAERARRPLAAVPLDGARLDQLGVDTVRLLTVDAVQKANSGHPGSVLGLAPTGFTLFTKVLQHNPNDPRWPNRDRFILSGGHLALLQYSLLHLTGYDLPLDQFKEFRQLHSLTPGHPKRGLTPGVEVSTGPLGQGIANAVGMAISEKWIADHFNEPGHEIIDHHTWVEAGDGDIMEGISSEAAAIAGQLGLEKLTLIYDANKVSADGSTDKTLAKEDTARRFKAFGWRVLEIPDANDMVAIEKALLEAKKPKGKPTLIVVRSTIAEGGMSKKGDMSTHGTPLGTTAIAEMKKGTEWETKDPFFVPEAVKQHSDQRKKGSEIGADWNVKMAAYAKAFPKKAAELKRVLANELPKNWDANLPVWKTGEMVSTEVASGATLNALAKNIPEMLAGSADLGASTSATIDNSPAITSDDFTGRNIAYGVREHAMTAILNGISAHGGVRSFSDTYLTFGVDYGMEGMRMAAQMHLPAIELLGHDSFLMGQDGASHHAVGQLAAIRASPGIVDLRPADANEVRAAWQYAMQRTDGPTALVLSKQAVPVLAGTDPSKVVKGAYVLEDRTGAKVVIIGTGSEVSLAVDAAKLLEKRGVSARVVSMPSWKLFRDQGEAYRKEVLPPGLPVLSVEAAASFGWAEWSQAQVALDHYGDSAPGPDLRKEYGFEPTDVADAAQKLLAKTAA